MCICREGPFVDSWGSIVETLIFIFKLKILPEQERVYHATDRFKVDEMSFFPTFLSFAIRI